MPLLMPCRFIYRLLSILSLFSDRYAHYAEPPRCHAFSIITFVMPGFSLYHIFALIYAPLSLDILMPSTITLFSLISFIY